MIRTASMRRCGLLLLALALAVAWWWSRPPVASARKDVVRGPALAQAMQPVPASKLQTNPTRRNAKTQAPDADPGEDPAVRACGEDTLQAFKASGARLAASEDARDRAVGALVSNIGLGAKPGQAVRVLATAMDKSPRDPWIAFLFSQSCRAPGCDPDAAASRLLELDPDNAFAWLEATGRALARKDTVAAERMLQQAAGAKRADPFWSTSGRMVFERTGAIPRPASCTDQALAKFGQDVGRPATMDEMRAMYVMATAAFPLPTVRPVSELCPTRSSVPSRRLETCRRLYARLASSDVLLYQSMGVRGMQTYAETDAERARWQERRRRLDWMTLKAGERFGARHLPFSWEYGEVPTMIGVLEEAGLWPPPPQWKSPWLE